MDSRICKCIFCGNPVKSDNSLPHFKFRPDKVFDTYFCGKCIPNDVFVDACDLLYIE